MRKLGMKVLVFGLIFFITLQIGGKFDNIDQQNTNNPNIIRMANASRFDSLDILFVGSSACYSGINPLYFDSVGLRTYNLSVAAAGPYFYELLINDYLRCVTKKPKSVFIQVLPSTFMSDIDNFSNIGIHRYLQYPVSNEKIAMAYNEWASYPSLLLKSFQKGIRNLVYIEKASPVIVKQTLSDKGFYRSDEISSEAGEAVESQSRSKWKQQQFDTAKFNYMYRYIDSLKKHSVKVVLFSVSMNKLSDFFSRQYMSDYRNAVSKISSDNLFLNTDQLLLDRSAYRDSDHLNTHGAAIVTKTLIGEIFKNKELRQLYNLPDSVSVTK